jgi:hypothetical protein
MALTNSSVLSSDMRFSEKVSAPRRIGMRVKDIFLNVGLPLFSKTLASKSRTALEPMSIDANLSWISTFYHRNEHK